MDHIENTHAAPFTNPEATETARRLIAAVEDAYRPEVPTSYRDTSLLPKVGDAPPVPQPDNRVVPQWAVGTAVASIGVGAGVTGIGCGAWLVFQGLSAVSLAGVLVVIAPFAGVAVVALAVGAAASKVKANSSTSTHIYQAPVTKTTEVRTQTRGMFSRTRNELHD